MAQISARGSKGHHTFYLKVEETSTNTSNNTSTVTINFWMVDDSNWYFDGWGSALTYTVTVNGTKYTGNLPDHSTKTTNIITNRTQTIEHDSDGTKTISFSFSTTDSTSKNYTPGTASASGTLTLTAIPRTSSISVNSYTISNTTGQLSATITSKANYYHSWRWKMGDSSWTNGSGSSLININNTNLTINISNTSLLNSLPTSVNGVLTIEVTTYRSNSTALSELLGSSSATANITINGVKPSITNASLTYVNPTGVSVSGFIAGVSTGSVTSTTNNSTGATSSITTYFTTSHGTLSNPSLTGTGAKANTIDQLPSSSSNYTLTVKIYAVDSRGVRSDEVTLTATVNGYILPRASLTAYRVGSSGSTTEDGSGNFVYISYSGSISSSIGEGSGYPVISCKYDLSSVSSSSQNVNVPSSPAWISASGDAIVTVTLTVTDKVSSSVVTVTVSSAAYPLDLYDDGEGHVGIAFGKEAKPDITSSAMQITGPGAIEYITGTWTATSGTWTGVTKDYELYDGKQILLYMPFAGSGNATLNLTLADGSTTGAKEVYFEGNTRFTTHKGQYSVLHLIYLTNHTVGSTAHASGAWWYIANRDTTDVYKLSSTYNSWKAKTNLYRYQVLLTYDDEYLLPVNAINNSTATNKTLTTESFYPLSQVWWWQSTGTASAGAKIPDWNQVAAHFNSALADLRYAFNTGTTLTANKSIYLVCVPQPDGKAKLHTTPIVQSLPTTEDGLIYKYLGRAYDTYRVTFDAHKPCYYYHDGAIREWTVNNWVTLWTGTLQGKKTQAINMANYSRIKIFAMCFYSQLIFEIDLTTSPPRTYQSGYPYAAGGFASELTTSKTCEQLFCFASVNTDKTTLNNAHMGYVLSGSTTLRDEDENFYIYRVDGRI